MEFSRAVIELCKKVAKNTINVRLVDQLVRSATSVGANYREANEKLSKKDFLHWLRIARKECKESTYWLELLRDADQKITHETNDLISESQELRNIFTAILDKSR